MLKYSWDYDGPDWVRWEVEDVGPINITVEELRERIVTPIPDLGERIIVYTAFGRTWRKKIDVSRARECGISILVFTDAESAKAMPIGSIGVDTTDMEMRQMAALYKIATPLLLDAGAFINLDADTEIRGRPDQIAAAFALVEKFDLVAGLHPVQTWVCEPIPDAVKEILAAHGINLLTPLWLGCGIGRLSPGRLTRTDLLTRSWFDAYTQIDGIREQPSFLLAVHDSGVHPFTVGEGWLSYSMDCEEALFRHVPQSAPVVSFFGKQIKWMAEQRDIEKCLVGNARKRWQLHEIGRLAINALNDLEADDGSYS